MIESSCMHDSLMGIISTLYETFKPICEEIDRYSDNLKKGLLTLGEATRPLQAYLRLGEEQFTYWKVLSKEDLELILNGNVNDYLEQRIKNIDFIDYEYLYSYIQENQYISSLNIRILSQCRKAIDAEMYDVALIGLVTVYDGVLAGVSEIYGSNFPKRLKSIKEKLEKLLDEEKGGESNGNISLLGLYCSWTKSMNKFIEIIDFKDKEEEPKCVNRHWIIHGRKTFSATKIDCYKVLGFIYGLLLISDHIECGAV